MTKIFNKKRETIKRKVLRKNLPKQEIDLWLKLKNKQIAGYKFRRQYSIGRYVVDFYSPALQLAIEIDGNSHFVGDAPEYDRQRQDYLETLGISVLRFKNTEISENLEDVVKQILEFCKKHHGK